VMLTLMTSSLAIGISSSVSVYEAEVIEGEKEVKKMERAMLRNLDNTVHTTLLRINSFFAAFVIFLTPLLSCTVAISPFILRALIPQLDEFAPWMSILFSLSALAVVGTVMGWSGKANPFLKGLRMTLFGILAFGIGYLLQMLL
ncbi:MAG TPA: hypothetical protein ENN76_00835, partial [Euryarchaeota archaeon]|nr:hypothetical protein [Euryarchaeota archaeon]